MAKDRAAGAFCPDAKMRGGPAGHDAAPARAAAMAMAIASGIKFTAHDSGLGIVARRTMQVAGHSGMLTMQVRQENKWKKFCLKPVQSGERGAREISFYEFMLTPSAVVHGSAEIRDNVERRWRDGLQPFLCDYHGVIVLGANRASEQRYLVLDDCTNEMRRPSALDIKLGTRTTEPRASLEKQHKSLAKYPCQTELGCRLVGMRVWSPVWKSSHRSNAVTRTTSRRWR